MPVDPQLRTLDIDIPSQPESLLRLSLLMGRLATSLQMDAWAAHSAGLFEECGKAVLFRHAPDHYRSVLRAATNDVELVELESAGFGVSHDALGAALCESWGLSPAAVVSVRHHVAAQAALDVPQTLHRRSILALSVVAASMVRDADEDLDERVVRIAPQCDIDTHGLLRAARRVQDRLAQAMARGR
jgi:HD-like signal output (HDOD) protein